jgi:hypothetical protein
MKEAIINPSPDNLVSLLFTSGHKIKSKALSLVLIQTNKFNTQSIAIDSFYDCPLLHSASVLYRTRHS